MIWSARTWWQRILIVAGALFIAFMALGLVLQATGYHAPTPTASPSTSSAVTTSPATTHATTPAVTTSPSPTPTPRPAGHHPHTAPPAPAASPTPPPVTTTGCQLHTSDRNLIERDVVPNLDATAIEIGDVNYPQCRPTLDVFPATVPTGPGYCSTIAYAADNPGYDVTVSPAPPLRKVIEAIGDAC